MKKVFLGIVIGLILSICLTPFAADVTQFIALKAGFPILVNGVEFKSDKPIVTINGSTYLPLRAIGDATGVKVNWNAGKGQAEIGAGPNDAQVSKGISFFNFKITNDEYGFKMFSEVQNTNQKKKSFTFTITYFDDNKKILGTAMGSASDVEPMGIITVESIRATDFDSYSSFKIQVDTIF